MILRSGSYEAHVHEDIGRVDPGEWDSLRGPGDLIASHGFVSACQSAGIEEARYRHVLIYRRGRLMATATLSLMNVRLELLSSTRLRRTVRRVRHTFPSFLRVPFLFCGLPVSTGRSSLRMNRDASGPEIAALVCEVMDRLGDRWGAQVFCFKEFTADQLSRVASIGSRGYVRAHSLPTCVLPISWRSFDDYLAQMRAGYRRQAKADLAVRASADLEFCVLEDFEPECATMFRLYEQVMDRVPYKLERLNYRFFEQVNARLGPQAWMLLLKQDGDPIASALMLEEAGILTFAFVGIDYTVNRTYHSYFNVLLEIVAQAIGRAASEVVLGQTSYRCKQRLGAEVLPLYLMMRHRSPGLHRVLRPTLGMLFPPTNLPDRRVFKEQRGRRRETA